MSDDISLLSAAELLARYAAGERVFRDVLLVAPGSPGQCVDLRGANLEGIDLSDAHIVADFRGASLRGARFVGAWAKACDFRGADLTGAVFGDAVVEFSDFAGAIVTDADFGDMTDFLRAVAARPDERSDRGTRGAGEAV